MNPFSKVLCIGEASRLPFVNMPPHLGHNGRLPLCGQPAYD